ncbi:DNA topoisomerase IV [Marixanthomonas ophiurae]|uniref:DNA topoisomerase IV n=1 Tax=Marixanthomonas ophiurae TaxID=387659 RepID=A0A3E1Q857_9FLAO|nr:DNA topoisomerase IV [Marixanthomonas ophiurae]RFN58316.1 DNA topoisomerase IV [Marixanthomonas ophiurae]
MRLLSSIFLLFILVGCYQPERNCEKFKNGTFEFKALVGTELQTTTFMRNDSIEIDYYQGKADTSSVRWINDCEYIVQKINPKNRSEEKAIHMKILTTDGDEYTFEYNIVGQEKKQKGTATKVESSEI